MTERLYKKMAERKVSYLTTAEFARLNYACVTVTEAFQEPPYLVGSATETDSWRDVDVRSILDDEKFDAYFPNEFFWGAFCLGMSELLSRMSGLPVDFQVQRRSEANAKYPGPRNPIGTRGRTFAGAGDATPFREPSSDAVLREGEG